MKKLFASAILASLTFMLSAASSHATPFTLTSPTSCGPLPAGVSEIGGIVIDLVGLFGGRVVAQASAAGLFVGYYDSGAPVSYRGNPGKIGDISGFGSAVTGVLGGGLSEMSVRMTLWDGDSGPGDFDYSHNFLLVNDILVGDFSSVLTERTTPDGLTSLGMGSGFGDGVLSTGFLLQDNPLLLSVVYSALVANESVAVSLFDLSPYDNYYDFTTGIDPAYHHVGLPPTMTLSPSPSAPVPEPATILLFVTGCVALAGRRYGFRCFV